MKSTFYRVPAVALSVLFGATLAAALASAATTISTNIQTDGTLSVTGTSTLTGKVGVGTANPLSQLYISTGGTSATPFNTKGLTIDNSNGTGDDGGAYLTFLAPANNQGGILVGGPAPAGQQDGGFVYENASVGGGYANGWATTIHSGFVEFLSSDGSTGITNAYRIPATISSAGNMTLTPTGGNLIVSTGKVGIGTTTPATKLQVSSGASATTTVTVGELGLSSSKACVNMNRADGGPGSFYISAAGAMVVESNYCR